MSPDHQAVAIVKRLREEGYESYLAGGCVRDFLLNKTPQDYDIATSARPEDVQRIFPRTIPVGAQFGVVLVMLDGQSFEVASFRFDGPYLDGRRPSQVRYGTLQEDIFRRDFTINGMVYDPSRESGYRLGRRQERSCKALHPRHRRSAATFRRRPIANGAGDPLCRQLELRYRQLNLGRHQAVGGNDHADFVRTNRRGDHSDPH